MQEPSEFANHETGPSRAGQIMDEVLSLRASIIAESVPLIERFGGERASPAIRNLAHYLCLRHHDLRMLQRRLMHHGLSSLGHLESRVLPTLDSVLVALAAITGRESPVPLPGEESFFAGEVALDRAADELFGKPPAHRRSRIMVTLPTEAAGDQDFVTDLVRRGMDVARINCAHDDHIAWRAMAAHVRAAGEALGRRPTILMDIAGPKIRTEEVAHGGHAKLKPGNTFRLIAQGKPEPGPKERCVASVSLPEMVTRLGVGDRIRYDDGKLEGVVESVGDGEAVIRVSRAGSGGTKMKPQKGINLPDTALGLSPLTTKDKQDLTTVIECADMIGYSFVSQPEDIELIEEAIARSGVRESPLGLVAKIERPEAVRNLPDLIAHADGRRPLGVMIARGDLAAEIGFERLAEMQEEILWVCEAASVPVIWATQVLEDLVKEGTPSRGEMTDAAMAARAECVMLNKGPVVGEAVGVLDRLLARMDEHIFKKAPRLRALKSW
ncbi:MAG: pyruvate kinase [Salaquimonas sp.]|nr:pyruvate kinase [Salaquimonas sp.]